MIIRVDMSKLKVTRQAAPEAYHGLGGRYLTSKIVHDEVPPTCHPLGPSNKLVIAPGLLAGTAAPSTGRVSVGAKSPLTQGIKESNAGTPVASSLGRMGIKAIVLEIDSPGGYPVAAEEVANALKRAKKPTIALIREYGTSGAYYAATGADVIFASQNSDIGSIGVTMSYLDHSKENEKDGLTYNQISAGKFKDSGDSNKSLTLEEKELFMRDINILHENFIEAVADNRNIDIEKVKLLADGSTMLGQMALENNLIDHIGGRYEVEEYLRKKIGGNIEICW